jgi:hypothetical protein
MREKIKQYILEYAAYDNEPFHLIISALLSEGLCKNANEIIPYIIELHKNGYLECYYHTCYSGNSYERIERIEEKDLEEYVSRNESQGFDEYPEKGGEYFFKTTSLGEKLIEKRSI